MFGTNQDVQFGRRCTLIFDNYTTGKSTLINDYSIKNNPDGSINSKFRVAFSFTKNLDEKTNWSNGSIRVYGLTLETFNSLGDYLETEIEVQVGYEYSTIPMRKLFRSVLIDKSYVVTNGISESTFNVQGYYYQAKVAPRASNSKTGVSNMNTGDAVSQSKMSFTFPEKYSVFRAIEDIIKNTAFPYFSINLSEVKNHWDWLPEDEIVKYIAGWTFPYGKTYFGTPKKILNEICAEYGMGYSISNDNMVQLFFTPKGYLYHAEKLSGQSQKTFLDPFESTFSKADVSNSSPKSKVFNTSQGDSILLTKETGLIGIPNMKTSIVTKRYNATIEASEKVYQQKPSTTAKSKDGKAVIDKKTGKEKLKSPKTKKVMRRSVEAVCLINPAIEPQSYVTIDLKSDNEISGDYRVRTVKIDGDTESGSWTMALSLENEW